MHALADSRGMQGPMRFASGHRATSPGTSLALVPISRNAFASGLFLHGRKPGLNCVRTRANADG